VPHGYSERILVVGQKIFPTKLLNHYVSISHRCISVETGLKIDLVTF
jgi:hypothetical protein